MKESTNPYDDLEDLLDYPGDGGPSQR